MRSDLCGGLRVVCEFLVVMVMVFGFGGWVGGLVSGFRGWCFGAWVFCLVVVSSCLVVVICGWVGLEDGFRGWWFFGW